MDLEVLGTLRRRRRDPASLPVGNQIRCPAATPVVVGPAPRAGRGPPDQLRTRKFHCRGTAIGGRHGDKGDDVGVITKEEYVCDYCNKTIRSADVLIGKLALRKRGARGLGREVVLALHPACSEKLTDSMAAPPTPVRRPRGKRGVAKPAVAAKKAKVPVKASRRARA